MQMPRRARIDAPGVVQHVMVRGIEKRTIFADDHDRNDLIVRLSRILPECGATCFAWALMPNHVHLVVRTGSDSVSRLMARVGTGYARRFNERHERVGHLFQNRFLSRVVGDDADLACVVRYVHRNPIAAGIVASIEDLAAFGWTGHAALMGRAEPQQFHQVAEALHLFGETPCEARAQLLAFMRCEPPIVDSWSSGAPAEVPVGEVYADRLAELAGAICADFRVDADALRSRARSRPVAHARAALASAAATKLGIPLAEVARWLGVTRGALSHALAKRPLEP
jgi:putative transposase